MCCRKCCYGYGYFFFHSGRLSWWPLSLSLLFLSALFIAVAASESHHHPLLLPPNCCSIALHFPGCLCVGGAGSGMQQQQQQHVSYAGCWSRQEVVLHFAHLTLFIFSRWHQRTTSQSAAASMEAASDRLTWWYLSPSGREKSPVRNWGIKISHLLCGRKVADVSC